MVDSHLAGLIPSIRNMSRGRVRAGRVSYICKTKRSRTLAMSVLALEGCLLGNSDYMKSMTTNTINCTINN